MIELWPEQVEVLQKVRQAVAQGYRSILIVAPTGTGKAVMGASIIHKAELKGNCSMFMAHRRELVKQTMGKLDDFGVDHGIIMAGTMQQMWKGVQIASIDTLRSRYMTKGKRQYMDLPKISILEVDEAHRSCGATYTKLIDTYKEAGALVIGLTATPIRGDGKGLGRHYDCMVLAPTVQEMINNGKLVPPRYYAPTIPDLTGVKVRRGDYVEGELQHVMDQREAVGDIIDNWKRICPERPTIVFAAGVRHSIHIAEEFRQAGFSAEHVDGETSLADRDAILGRLRSGETQIISNCMVLTEGFDCPPLSCCVLARPTKNVGLYIQMGGRVLRTSPETGKHDAIIIDHSGNLYEHGFLEDDHGWVLSEAEGCTSADERQKKLDEEKKPITCMQCAHVYTGQLVCPKCGHVPQKRGEAVEMRHADLIEVRKEKRAAKEAKEKKDKPATHEEKQHWYSMLYAYAQEKGHSEGSIAHKYKAKFGVWPKNMQKVAVEANGDCLNHIMHLNIKYAKGKKRAAS